MCLKVMGQPSPFLPPSARMAGSKLDVDRLTVPDGVMTSSISLIESSSKGMGCGKSY